MHLANQNSVLAGLKRVQDVLGDRAPKRSRISVRLADLETPHLDRKRSGFWDAQVPVVYEPSVSKRATVGFKTRRNGQNYIIQQAIKNYKPAKPKIAAPAKPLESSEPVSTLLSFDKPKPVTSNPDNKPFTFGKADQEDAKPASSSGSKPDELKKPLFGIPSGSKPEEPKAVPILGNSFGLPSDSEEPKKPLFGNPTSSKPEEPKAAPILGNSFGLPSDSKPEEPKKPLFGNPTSSKPEEPKAASGSSFGLSSGSKPDEPKAAPNLGNSFGLPSGSKPDTPFAFGAAPKRAASPDAPPDTSSKKPFSFGQQPSAPPASSQALMPAFNTKPQFNFGGSSTSTPTFGANSTPAFGANSTPAFGANSTPAFGANSTPAFGANSAPQAAAASNPLMGGTSAPSNGRRIAPPRRPRR